MAQVVEKKAPWFVPILSVIGLVLVLPGIPLTFGWLCLLAIWIIEGEPEAASVGLVGFVLSVLTLGVGSVLAWHGLRSLQRRPSAAINWPPVWLIAGVFGLCVVLGLVVSQVGPGRVVLLPPVLAVAAALPPLLAVAWFSGQGPGEQITWRRAVTAFVAGATGSVLIAVGLELLFPLLLLALVLDLSDLVVPQMERLLQALAGRDVAAAITNRAFIYVFVQVALVAPLAEELAKPLVVLPVVRRLSRRQVFLVGAMAGAGFAALENILYSGLGFSFWAGILVVRAIGGAIHPLGAGLVSVGWRGVIHGEPGAGRKWLGYFGLAAGLHALWNGGSLLVIALAGAEFFGQLPPEINVLGLSAAGTTLALLIVLGLAALWLGRRMGQVKAREPEQAEPEGRLVLSDRAVAVWALACLVAVIPLGLAGLPLLLGR